MSAPRAIRVAVAALGLALLFIAGCRAPPRVVDGVTAHAVPAGGAVYHLDAGTSRIWLYLHADGPLAALGHTHVIVAHGLQGTIWLQPQLERSALELQLPVGELLVDDPAERAAAGSEFAEPLDDAARAGTREHLLGASQLDAAHYPAISLHSTAVQATPDGLLIDLQVRLRDHEATVRVPVHWEQHAGTLSASGETSVQQSALGLAPYTALFGALRVADDVRVRFELRAQLAP